MKTSDINDNEEWDLFLFLYFTLYLQIIIVIFDSYTV